MRSITPAFKILDYLELLDWKPLAIDTEIPLTQNLICPADNSGLQTLCTILGNKGAQRLRIGCCESCGYLGYIDRPAKKWLEQFYFSLWDKGEERDIISEVAKRKQRLSDFGLKKGRSKELKIFLEEFSFDKDRYLCEIGCGYGIDLAWFKKLGFKKLIGIENSVHRAEVARQVYGLEIIIDALESDSANQHLRKLAPLGTIVAHHVIEHVYNPAAFIEYISSLQSRGDYLILSLPNIEGEPSALSLFFFPHLHGFNRNSLTRLLRKASYRIIDATFTTIKELYVVAKKETVANDEQEKSARNYRELAVQKLKKGLGVRSNSSFPIRRLVWYRNFDFGWQLKIYENFFIDTIYKTIMNLFYHLRHSFALINLIGIRKFYRNTKKYLATQSFKIQNIEDRFTSSVESPFEIQFENEINLFYK